MQHRKKTWRGQESSQDEVVRGRNGVIVHQEPVVRSGGDIGQHTLCSLLTAIRETGYRR